MKVAWSDGWDKSVLEDTNTRDVLERINYLKYELDCCRKGCITGCHTYGELGESIIGFAEELMECGESVKNYEEESED